jgi:hypothetical protein
MYWRGRRRWRVRDRFVTSRRTMFRTFEGQQGVDWAIRACSGLDAAPVIGSCVWECPSGYPDGFHKGLFYRFASTWMKVLVYG